MLPVEKTKQEIRAEEQSHAVELAVTLAVAGFAVGFFGAMTVFGVYSWHSATLPAVWYLTLTIVGGVGTFSSAVTLIAASILLHRGNREEEPEMDTKSEPRLEVQEMLDRFVLESQRSEIKREAEKLDRERESLERARKQIEELQKELEEGRQELREEKKRFYEERVQKCQDELKELEARMEARKKERELNVQKLIDSIEKLDRRIKNFAYTLVDENQFRIVNLEGSLFILARQGFEVSQETVSYENLVERVAFYSSK